MNKFWVVFWSSFRNVCQMEFQNVSIIELIVLTLLGAVIVHVGCLIYVRANKKSIYLSKEIMMILLISYTMFIAQITWLNRGMQGTARVFDTKLLWIDVSMDQNITNLLNIILFIPFGILIAGLQRNKKVKKKIIMSMFYCFLTSLAIECTQFLTKRGYFEIDDLEANIIGGLIGSLFFSICLKIVRMIYKKNTEVKNENKTQAEKV